MQKAICKFDILAPIFPENLCKYASRCESTIYCQAYVRKNEKSMIRFARMQKNKGGERMTEGNKQAFPAEASINKYGFLYLSKEVLAATVFRKATKSR